MVTKAELLAKWIDQRDKIKAGSKDKVALRICRRALRLLKPNDDPEDLQDEFQELFELEKEAAQSFPPGDIDETERSMRLFHESGIAILVQRATLPDDDPQPRVVDKKKFSALLKRAARNVLVPDDTRKQCYEWLERFFETYLPERPAQAKLVALLASVTSPIELDKAALRVAEQQTADLVEKIENE